MDPKWTLTRKVGDRITVLESKFLGTPATEATIISLHPNGEFLPYYLVKCDDEEEAGTEVAENGQIIVGPPPFALG